jgi:lipopolysaccharide transport system ATP-binding protein
MSNIAIRVENLGKMYRIGTAEKQPQGVWETTKNLALSPFAYLRRIRKPPTEEEILWALRHVSFEVKRGEVVGVIGRNGAGKSTLLKVLTRITEPTEGQAILKGRVGSLLEVGTGFHPELTGRENVYLSGTILGMRKADVDRKFDEIVDFSGVEKFIDTPVKRYSSGMKVRLGFAVAAHLEPEILLIDEVLAVGDVAFQKKCLGKMDEVSQGGRTVLFISHNMGMIRSLCKRTILLRKGNLSFDGHTQRAVNYYLSSATNRTKDMEGEIQWDEKEAPGGVEIRLRRLRLLGADNRPTEVFDLLKLIQIEITYDVQQSVRGMRWIVQIITQEGVIAFTTTDHRQRGETVSQPGRYRTSCTIPPRLLNRGRYHLLVHAGIPGVKVLVPGREWLSFTTDGGNVHGSHYNDKNWPGAVAPAIEWSADKRLDSTRDATVQ